MGGDDPGTGTGRNKGRVKGVGRREGGWKGERVFQAGYGFSKVGPDYVAHVFGIEPVALRDLNEYNVLHALSTWRWVRLSALDSSQRLPLTPLASRTS
jgi:hypothetical protein